MPVNHNVQDNRKFVHKSLPDQGAIIARHFADSLTDCVKLCQWMNGPLVLEFVCTYIFLKILLS